MYTPG